MKIILIIQIVFIQILKDSTGRIIAIEQVPYSESGDWYEGFKHYFDSSGKTFAFTTRTTVFDDSVKGGVVMLQSFNYYNASFNLLDHATILSDANEKPVVERKISEFDFRHDPYHIYKNVKDCLEAYQINKASL